MLSLNTLRVNLVQSARLMRQMRTNNKSKKRKYCGHCKQYLSVPVFKRHKANFYNAISQKWRENETYQFNEARDVVEDGIINSSEHYFIIYYVTHTRSQITMRPYS